MQVHTCRHCAEVVIDFTHLENLRADAEPQQTRIDLKYGVQQAKQAANQGCSLFKWLLKTYHLTTTSEPPTMPVSFTLLIKSDNGFHDCWLVINRVDDTGQTDSLNQKRFTSLNSVFISCDKDESMAKHMSARPLECDVLSRRSVDFARDCLRTCLRQHENCRAEWLDLERSSLRFPYRARHEQLADEVLNVEELPTRLLCIYSSKELMIRLVVLSRATAIEKRQICAAGFAALSYCWGQQNTVQLTRDSESSLLAGLPVSHLPSTIQDAVRFAHSLELEYLWVDALCIFQDSSDDKNREIPRMRLYYGLNTVTLCAASSTGANAGLVSYQTPGAFGEGVFKLPCVFGDESGYVHLQEPMNATEPLAQRCWALQESLLSRRLLIFSRQLYWSCIVADAECEGRLSSLPRAGHRSSNTTVLSPVPGVYPAQAFRDWSPLHQWALVLRDYTSRQLGWGSDKLPAISSFAALVHNSLKVRGSCYKGARSDSIDFYYVAGLFLSHDQQFALGQLLWKPARTSGIVRPAKYRAPTWSWASLDGIIDDAVLIGNPSTRRRHSIPRIWKWSIQHESEDVYGSIKQAALSMEARVFPVHTFSKKHTTLVDSEREMKGRSEGSRSASILPDTPEDHRTIINSIQGSDEAYYLPLSGGSSTDAKVCQGLVLVRQPLSEPWIMYRIGTFYGYLHFKGDEVPSSRTIELL